MKATGNLVWGEEFEWIIIYNIRNPPQLALSLNECMPEITTATKSGATHFAPFTLYVLGDVDYKNKGQASLIF